MLALSLLGVRLIPQANQFDWGTFLAAAELGQVTGVQFRGVELRGTSSDPDVGRFEVPVGERDLQDLGRELEALGVAVDPEGRPARVRLESGDEGDPRTLVIEGVDGCEPCSPGADVELAAGWHRVRWEDEGPDTGTIVLADLEGGFPDAPIRVGPALAAEAGPARLFVGHGLRMSLVLPALPPSARVVEEVAEAEGGTVPGEPVDTQGGVVPADPAGAEVGQTPGGLADLQSVQAPAEGAPSGGGDPGGEPGVEDDADLLPVCSNLASVTITDFVYSEAERTLRLDYELFFDAPGLEAPPVQAVDMGLSFRIDDEPAGTADFTHLSPAGTVVRNGRAGYEGTRTVRLDEAAGGRSVDGVRLSARLRAEPVQPPNWPEGCAPPGFMESGGRDVVIPGTIVGAFSRGVLQFSLGQLQVSDDPERSLATRLAVELEGADWCGAGEFTLAVGDNEYDLGTAVHAFEVGETRTQQSIRFWATLEPGELPADVPDAVGEAQASVTARVYDQACSTLDLSTAVPVQEETVGPICLQKTPATAWEPCT
ncbi:MAG: hypothetical protein HKN73_18985 [Gemmatimonadetes bacterium]|nr:hypothetical protein [Gemmatimonadota bacterium]